MATTHVDLAPGTTIGGRYRILGVLGRGGMGTVYEAVQIEIGRAVAIKVLHAARARKKTALARFQREARTAASLGLAEVAHVYDAGALLTGEPFFVMERLDGETLRARLHREGALPLAHVVAIMKQVLNALDVAHARGVVHRDIKPENIFLLRASPDTLPRIKLIDFGVAKLTANADEMKNDEEHAALTATGIVVGTPWYLAPEQARGAKTVDARADLWTCGMILYEMLIGKRPVETGHAAPSAMRGDIPLDFDGIVAKATRPNPDERFQTAGELRTEIVALWDFYDPTEVRAPHSLEFEPAVPFSSSSSIQIAGSSSVSSIHSSSIITMESQAPLSSDPVVRASSQGGSMPSQESTAEARSESVDLAIDVTIESEPQDDEWYVPTVPSQKK